MRIIAGRFRHRTLRTRPGLSTRPITDRVKETLFARIEPLLPGAKVADVFAGTGTLGLEALSRGAERVVFLEQDRQALELLRENIRHLKVEAETLIWPADVLRCSFRPQRAEEFLPFDVIFFDPPYRLAPEIRAGSPLYRALERLGNRASAPEAVLLVRTPQHTDIDLPPLWQQEGVLTMSNMAIWRFRRRGSTGEMDVPPESSGEESPASGPPV